MSRWTEIRDRAVRWLLGQIGYYDCGPEDTNAVPPADGAGNTPPETPAGNPRDDAWDAPAATPPASPASSAYPLGIASCWHGTNASERMMNILSPRMPDDVFGKRLAFMKGKGCTVAHVFLANQGDGEYAGYAAWNDSDREKMLKRWRTIRDAGLVPVPWVVADDSNAYRDKLFADAEKLVGKMATFLASPPYVVIGLEMDEDKNVTADQWRKVRDAVRKHYKGPLGVHHCSGNEFKFASLGDIILGQLNPGCTESQVKSQIAAIKSKGKRAVGFEYARGPSRKLCLAALAAGAEGVGNWDGGEVPDTSSAGVDGPGLGKPSGAGAPDAADAVDYSLLDWRWGRFDGRKAVRAAGAEIGSLKVTPNGLSYKWVSGGCEDLDRSCSHSKPCCTCALFCCVNGKWIGGKFDHISTDRRTRDFANIRESYGGWIPAALSRADAFAFVILDDGGKRRTNVITCGR